MTLLAKVHKLVFPYMTLASDRVRWLPLNLECNISSCLWSPVTTGQAIIFCRGGFFFLSSSFAISSPILSGRRLHVYIPYFYTWCDVSANLECRSEMCCMWLAKYRTPKFAKCAPSHKFVGLYLASQLRHGKNSCQTAMCWQVISPFWFFAVLVVWCSHWLF